MRGAAVVALAVLTACGGGRAHPPEASPAPVATTVAPTPTPTPSDDVTVSTVTLLSGKGSWTWKVQLPKVHGLGTPDADARANAVLARVPRSATVPPPQDEQPASVGLTASLSAYDDRYATVETVAYFYSDGAAHGASVHETYVFRRSDGARLTLRDFLPDTRPATAYLTKRLPDVLGRDGMLDGWKVDLTKDTPFVPLPEGIEVGFAEYEVAPYAAGSPVVTVPWTAARSALPPSPGDAHPPYRDGERLAGKDLSEVLRVVRGATRVQRPQYFDSEEQWALAMRGTEVLGLRRDGERWVPVRPCTDLPPAVRTSVLLRCG